MNRTTQKLKGNGACTQRKFSLKDQVATQEEDQTLSYHIHREKAQPHQIKTNKNKTLPINKSPWRKQPSSPADSQN